MTAPGISESVHYVAYGTPGGEYESVCRAAIVTVVGDRDEKGELAPTYPLLGLAVLNPTGMFFNPTIPYAPVNEMRGGTWHHNCGRR